MNDSIKENPIDEDVFKKVKTLVLEEPVRMIQLLLLLIGKDLVKANATNNVFSVHADLPDGNRYEIKAKVRIKKQP